MKLFLYLIYKLVTLIENQLIDFNSLSFFSVFSIFRKFNEQIVYSKKYPINLGLHNYILSFSLYMKSTFTQNKEGDSDTDVDPKSIHRRKTRNTV